MTTTVTLRSPDKASKVVTVLGAPTVRKVQVAAVEIHADSSWDGGEPLAGEPNMWKRPSQEERPAARKQKISQLLVEREDIFAKFENLEKMMTEERRRSEKALGDVREEFQRECLALHETHSETQQLLISMSQQAIKEQSVIELYESLALVLRAFNDIIYDTARPPRGFHRPVMTEDTKKTLKANDLGYINRLFDQSLSNLSADAQVARAQALAILRPQERQVCKVLIAKQQNLRVLRNRLQHPIPDRPTALQRIKDAVAAELSEEGVGTLQAFLDSDPERIPGAGEERDSLAVKLFAREGEYGNVLGRQKHLVAVRMEKMKTAEKIKSLQQALKH